MIYLKSTFKLEIAMPISLRTGRKYNPMEANFIRFRLTTYYNILVSQNVYCSKLVTKTVGFESLHFENTFYTTVFQGIVRNSRRH